MEYFKRFKDFFSSQVDNYSLHSYETYYKRWRLTGVGLFILAFLIYSSQAPSENSVLQEHLAKIHVDLNPAIRQTWIHQLEYAIEDPNVKGILLFVDQAIMDGSDFAQTESALQTIFRAKKSKPIVSFIYGYAHGNSYVIASASDYIVAQETSSIGGVSVVTSKFDTSELMKRVGVKVVNRGFGDYKIEPEKSDPNYEKFIQHRLSVYQKMHEWMMDNIIHNRHLDARQAKSIEDGQWYTGNRAKSLALCDEVGDIIQAENWLRHHSITRNQDELPIIDYSNPHAEAELGLDNISWLRSAQLKLRKSIQRLISEHITATLSAWQYETLQKTKIL
ncbi:MAG: S49 family peptidase [Pseudomonadota bacterium]|nr:S49 family peptidase [Pseudomonadota bacterium]